MSVNFAAEIKQKLHISHKLRILCYRARALDGLEGMKFMKEHADILYKVKDVCPSPKSINERYWTFRTVKYCQLAYRKILVTEFKQHIAHLYPYELIKTESRNLYKDKIENACKLSTDKFCNMECFTQMEQDIEALKIHNRLFS